MNKKLVALLCVLVTVPSWALSSTLQQKLNAVALMSGQDMANNASSNANLINKTGQALTVYGLYVAGIAFILPGQNCQDGVQSEGQNYTFYQGMAGGAVTPIAFSVGQSVTIGQNYLYNMLYAYFYWSLRNNNALTCALPGCSWSTDTTHYNWCLQLGAVSPDSSYTYSASTAKTLPFAWPASLSDYDYALIPTSEDYVFLGPFTCDDKTLTCVTPNAQSQSFQSSQSH